MEGGQAMPLQQPPAALTVSSLALLPSNCFTSSFSSSASSFAAANRSLQPQRPMAMSAAAPTNSSDRRPLTSAIQLQRNRAAMLPAQRETKGKSKKEEKGKKCAAAAAAITATDPMARNHWRRTWKEEGGLPPSPAYHLCFAPNPAISLLNPPPSPAATSFPPAMHPIPSEAAIFPHWR